MSLVEAKEIIRKLRSRGIKVGLYNGQPLFSTLADVSNEDKLLITRMGPSIQSVLKEEQVRRDARQHLKGTSDRLAARRKARENKTLTPIPDEEL